MKPSTKPRPTVAPRITASANRPRGNTTAAGRPGATAGRGFVSGRPRRGMAVLIVLLLLSLTLGLSYAAMRSQTMVGMIQRNSDRQASARQAASTGLSMALKKMSRSDWAGVDTSLGGPLNATDSFLVTYTTGDTGLSAGDPDQPYRVTLLSTGYSADPEQPQSIAVYRVRAVVRLIPRKLADEPADWATMMGCTVYQWTSGSFTMTIPSRIEGTVCIQSALDLLSGYAWPSDHLGDAYAKAGRPAKAVAAWRKAAELFRGEKETEKAETVEKKTRME